MSNTAQGAMTIDVEEYFQVEAFAGCIERSEWRNMASRIDAGMDRLFELFERKQVRATFFTLGCVAEQHPKLIEKIVAAGHELGSHGYGHRRVVEMTPAAFADDVKRAKQVLEQLGGVEVKGYRAPCFSIAPDNDWAHDLIVEAGHSYSSSVYPIRHDLYGAPEATRQPFVLENGLLEIPVTTGRAAGLNLPLGGGGYFRLLPYPLYAWLWRNFTNDLKPVFYLHPWELDPAQPRVVQAPWRSRLRHYINLTQTEPRLSRLLDEVRWGRMDECFLGKDYPSFCDWPTAAQAGRDLPALQEAQDR